MKTLEFTTEDINRVNEGIIETQKLIDRENNFSFDLRKHDKVERLENHLTYLKSVLENEEF